MAVFLVVRSVVQNGGDRAAFDHWYSTDHMPKALAQLGALAGWRYWSETDPAVHYAVYHYESLDAVTGRDADGRRSLMAEYEAAWPGVTRTREIVRLVDKVVAL